MDSSVRFDVKLRSGMEIYDLMPPSSCKITIAFARNDRKGRSGVKIQVIFDESCEILDQATGDLTRHNRAMPHLANSDREAKPLQVD
jgi:hypothetical protein